MSRAPTPEVFFACDVGNSRVAFALVVEGRIEQVVHVPLGALDGLAATLRLDPAIVDRPHNAPLVVASVNPDATAELRRLMAEVTTGAFLLARENFPVPIEAAVDAPDRVGVDRLLAALAAHRITGRATVVVDVGTAVTVDAVDAAGRFLGGCILPGPTLAARSLHRYTAALPEVRFCHGDRPPETALGRNTEAAIRGGVLYGVAGAVERLIAEHKHALGTAAVIGTGGGIEFLLPACRAIEDVRPNLVLEGLVAAYTASLT